MGQLRLGELLLLLMLAGGHISSTQAENGTFFTTAPVTTVVPEPPCDPLGGCCPCSMPRELCVKNCPSGYNHETCEGGNMYRCKKEGKKLPVIALIAGGCGLLVLLVIIILICACRRRRKRASKAGTNVEPLRCAPRQSIEQGREADEQQDDTYLIVLPDEGLPCSSSNTSTSPTTDTMYVNVPKGPQEGNSPRLPAKTPPSQLKFNFKEESKNTDEAVKTDSIYVNVPNEMNNGVSPRSSSHPNPPMDGDDDDKDGNSDDDRDEDAYDYPGAPYAKPVKEAKAKPNSPKRISDEQQQSPSPRRGRAPAVPSRDQDIYSPVYEERNMARGVNFPSSPKLGSPAGSPNVTTDHVYGNVPFGKASRSPSAPDVQKAFQHRLSPPGYLPMAGSEGRLTSFQYARDSAENDELYVNDPQIYVNTTVDSSS